MKEEYSISLHSCKQKIGWLSEVNEDLMEAMENILMHSEVVDTEKLDGTHEIHLIVTEEMIKRAKQAISKAEGRD